MKKFRPFFTRERVAVMDYDKLYETYLALIAENKALKKENKILKARLGITERR